MNKNESKYFNTASLMDEALLNLLEKKDYDFITVKEICQKAGVSRSTFYLHYETMDDLLKETIEKVNKDFNNSFADTRKNNLTKKVLTREEFLIPYLSYIKENKRIYLLMHQKPYLFGIEKTFKRQYANIFDDSLSNFKVPEKEKKYIFSFYTYGVLSIVKTWINNDCEDDIEFIVSIIERLTNES